MISAEELRRYPYFVGGEGKCLLQIALMAREATVAAGESLFVEGDKAEHLYVVTAGEMDISLALGSGKSVVVDTSVAGDLVGWSAVSAPYIRTGACVARKPTRLISIDAVALRELAAAETDMGYQLMSEMVKVLSQRLDGTRVQLAAEAG
jgi:CRP/FNR family transcriptional regulator, cyclic AMP receptor protein